MQISFNPYFLCYSILSSANISLKDITDEIERRLCCYDDIAPLKPLENIDMADLLVLELTWADCAAIALCIENAIELGVSPELLYELYKMPY